MKAVRPEKGAWTIVALLFLFMMINFADKAIIGLAGVPIMTELNLTPKQFGLVGSSFFLLFSISAVVTGFIVNRVRSKLGPVGRWDWSGRWFNSRCSAPWGSKR